ncbi:hypothetical protein PUN28_004771 [Cardiocondyla obscurior]|uniref:Secreted protein n=1 Tax=Cardiocondyla obscurior TaxID=286306 RepID=A0AAW2GF79_9HYME
MQRARSVAPRCVPILTRTHTRACTHAATIFDVKTRRKNPSQTDRCEICGRDRVKISAHRRPCLNVHRTGAKPTHDRIFQLRVIKRKKKDREREKRMRLRFPT